MDIPTVVVGAAICCYGLVALGLRLAGKEQAFKKLEPMRRLWGPRLGSAIHYVGYVVVPIVVGALITLAGMGGVKLLG